jgi:hypothetical protein
MTRTDPGAMAGAVLSHLRLHYTQSVHRMIGSAHKVKESLDVDP